MSGSPPRFGEGSGVGSRSPRAVTHKERPMRTRPLLALAAALAWAAAVPAAEPEPVAIKVSDDRIDFLAGKEVVAKYHKAESVAKPYLWPVLGPGGVPLTRAWPMEK